MGFLHFFKPKISNNEQPYIETPKNHTTWVEAMNIEDPFEKERMLTRAEKNAENIIELHFIFNQFIHLYYRQWNNWKHAPQLCKEYCGRDIEIFPKFIESYIEENLGGDRDPNKFPLMLSFKRLATIHEDNGDIQQAMNICKLAVDHHLRDGSEEGFKGRLMRLEGRIESESTG